MAAVNAHSTASTTSRTGMAGPQAAILAQRGDGIGGIGHLQVDDRRALTGLGHAQAEIVQRRGQPLVQGKRAIEHARRARRGMVC